MGELGKDWLSLSPLNPRFLCFLDVWSIPVVQLGELPTLTINNVASGEHLRPILLHCNTVSPPCHLPVTSLSYPCHVPVTSLSPPCHLPVITPSSLLLTHH